MCNAELIESLASAYDAAPKIDAHTHLSWRQPAATAVEDIVFYHMLGAEWNAAGIQPHVPEHRRSHSHSPTDWTTLLQAAGNVAPRIRNSALARALLAIGRDLFAITRQHLDANFLQELNAAVASRADLAAWAEHLFDRLHLVAVMSSNCGGSADLQVFPQRVHQRIQPTYERDFFLPAKHARAIVAHIKTHHGIDITDLDSATAWFWHDMTSLYQVGARIQVKWFPPTELMATLDKDRAAAAIRSALAGQEPSPEEAAALATYMFAQRLAFARAHGQTVQICSMAVHITQDTYTLPLTSEVFLRNLVAWIDRTPDVNFDILNCDPVTEPFFLSLARTRPNVYLCGVWWHAMSDAWIEEMFYRRFLTVPLCKLSGFFSDAYCAEWIYGKHVLMRSGIVRALARAVHAGVFTPDECPAVLRQLLYETPARLAGLPSTREQPVSG
ncbi:MAG: hypothetical protein N2595_02605 [bacterium]|nr:hypothetical protein [bacterium]